MYRCKGCKTDFPQLPVSAMCGMCGEILLYVEPKNRKELDQQYLQEFKRFLPDTYSKLAELSRDCPMTHNAFRALRNGTDYDEVLPALIEGLSKAYRQILKADTKPFTVDKI